MQKSEEILYEMFWNSIYMYQLINNYCFDQENELKLRLFWGWIQKHNKEKSIGETWLCLYGLDTNTQLDLIRGCTSRYQIIAGEQLKYFDMDEKRNKYTIKNEWRDLFRNYKVNEITDKSMKEHIENVIKISLVEDFL